MNYTIPDLWQLDEDSPDWLPSIIVRLLSVGVPPTAIGHAFDIEPDAVKELQMDIRIARYGTAELAEAMNAMMWRAYEDVQQLIMEAPPARRLQLNMSLLSKASALVGSKTSDSMDRMRSELETLFGEQRQTTVQAPTASIYETRPTDAPPDDPEKGSTG